MGLPALLVCWCLSAPAPAGDRWFADDKLRHFLASFVVTSLSASGARAAGLSADESVWVGAGLGTSSGIWKELRDRGQEGGTASLRDLVWDLGGVGAASAVMAQVR